MRYCRRCRLYFEEELEKCPLCGKNLTALEHTSTSFTPVFTTGRLPKAEEQESFWIEQKKTDKKTIKKRLLSIYFLLTLISVIVLIGTDLAKIFNGAPLIFQSYVPIISIVFTFSLVLIFLRSRSAATALWSMGLSISLFLFLLDIRDFKLTWLLAVGLPTTWAALFPWLLPVTFWNIVRIKGLNIIGFFFIGLAVSLVFIDYATSAPLHKLIEGWSIITFCVLLAVSLLFFYLHYVLKIHIYLDHIFKLQRTNRDIL
jgi:hypothetical protein